MSIHESKTSTMYPREVRLLSDIFSYMPDKITTKEVAKILGVHIKTVENLVKRGELNPVMFGRSFAFDKGEVMRVKKARAKRKKS